MLWIILWSCTISDKTDTALESSEIVDWSSWSPRERGPFNVGHIQIEHTYQPLSDQPERTIPIEVWYPTEDTSGTPATYFMGIDESVFADATPAAPVHELGYPVHLSSHGYQGWGANSAFLMSHFASHGWVVVAPNHIDNTLVDHSSPLPIRHFIHRPKDLTESLNVLEALDWGYPIHTDSVVLSGHSFGASYSTWAGAGATYDNVDAVCTEGAGLEDSSTPCSDSEYEALSSNELDDPRVTVAIPMAGVDRKAFFGPTGYQNVHAPVLFVSGTEDGQNRNQDHFDDVTGIDFRWLSLTNACHQSFTVGGCATMDTELAWNILNHYVLAFSRQRLLGDDSTAVTDLFDGTSQPWTEATLLIRE